MSSGIHWSHCEINLDQDFILQLSSAHPHSKKGGWFEFFWYQCLFIHYIPHPLHDLDILFSTVYSYSDKWPQSFGKELGQSLLYLLAMALQNLSSGGPTLPFNWWTLGLEQAQDWKLSNASWFSVAALIDTICLLLTHFWSLSVMYINNALTGYPAISPLGTPWSQPSPHIPVGQNFLVAI